MNRQGRKTKQNKQNNNNTPKTTTNKQTKQTNNKTKTRTTHTKTEENNTKFLAVDEAYKAIFWPTPSLQDKNFGSCGFPDEKTVIFAAVVLHRESNSATEDSLSLRRPRLESLSGKQWRQIRSRHIKGSKESYLFRQKHNLQIFGVIPFVKLQNDT